jgi:hypothetical protein
MTKTMMKLNKKNDFVHNASTSLSTRTGHSGHQLDTIQFRSVTAEQLRSYKLDTITGEGKAGKREISHKGTKTRRKIRDAVSDEESSFNFVPLCLRGRKNQGVIV